MTQPDSERKSRWQLDVGLPNGDPDERLVINDLIDHINSTGRDYIIQGLYDGPLSGHPFPSSLDAWLRMRVAAERRDIPQAIDELVDELTATTMFIVQRLLCPDSGKPARGLRLLPSRLTYSRRASAPR